MTCRNQRERRFIGDDWVFEFNLTDDAGSDLDISGSTLCATYFAPFVSSAAPTDVSSTASILEPTTGLVQVIVPSTLTAEIPSLPTGRKRRPAHLQVQVITAEIKETRAIFVIDPLDPATYAEGDGGADAAQYHRAAWPGLSDVI